jgi:seryl-tRNA synthetase
MIDIRILRADPEMVKANCARRGCTVDIDTLSAQDQEYLALVKEVESMRAERNALSKQCRDNPDAREQVKELKVVMAEREAAMAELKAKVDEGLTWLPNFLADDVPDGDSDEDNDELRFEGVKPEFNFEPVDHQAIGDKLGIIDTARGAKVAQAGFYYWVGKGAQLTNAMFFWAQKELVSRGFTLFTTPCAAKQHTLFGTGYLPFFADQTYNLANEDLSLIGTSEQTLVGVQPLLPHGVGQLRQGIAGNLPRSPVPQGRADCLLSAGGLAEVPRFLPGERGGPATGPRHSVPRGERVRRRYGCSRLQEI